MKYKRLIILLLIFTIISNFIFIPKKAEASVAVTLSLLYGLSVGEAVLGFILTSAAIGVTYLTLEEAKKAYDIQKAIDFEELMLIPSIDPRPPGEQEPPGEPPKNWRDQVNKLLKGTGLSGLGLVLLYNLKEWYQGLGAKEGENLINEGFYEFGGDIIVNTKIKPNENWFVTSYNGNVIKIGQGRKAGNYTQSKLIYLNTEDTFTYLTYADTDDIYKIKVSMSESQSVINFDLTVLEGSLTSSTNFSSLYLSKSLLLEDGGYQNNPTLIYYVTNNSTVLTDILPKRSNDVVYDYGLQGEMIYPGQLSNPTIQPNIDVIPQEKFETIILPNGTTQKRYKGTQEQMLQDIVNNTTIENVYNNTQNYTITNEGDTLIINEGSTTTPYPTPTPGETPSTPVEPDSQLDYTPWYQSIINWLSLIYNKISENIEKNEEVEPEPDPEPEPEPEPEVPQIDFSPLQSIDLKDKFPFSLPWDIKASIELLVDNPQALRWEVPIVTETIIIDLVQFEQLALISRSFLSIIYIIILVILTRRFIGGG